MNTTIHNVNKSYLGTDAIPGLIWRGFQGETDYPKILNVAHASNVKDGIERADTLKDIANIYSHLHNCDPYQDMLFAEVNDEVVGYSRVWWDLEGSGKWIGFQQGNVLPEWRHKGIGSKLQDFNEYRLSQIATQLKTSGEIPKEAPCSLDVEVSNSEVERIHLFERRGYRAIRYTYDMLRPDLENVPDLPLPPGVEVRPVKPEHFRLIWKATNEAFKDHWGYIPDPWEEFERWMNDADFDPSLWQVAWHEDQIAGMVICFIEKDENELFGRKRGYTENICVLRPWRRQGLAKALIAMGLSTLKERGMTEAALGVDSENTSGALNLYKGMGYQVVKGGTIYHKAMNA